MDLTLHMVGANQWGWGKGWSWSFEFTDHFIPQSRLRYVMLFVFPGLMSDTGDSGRSQSITTTARSGHVPRTNGNYFDRN